MERIQFSLLPISEEVKKAVSEMGFEEATAIQTQSIPLIMEGNDIIGHSQTGTGKTAAFGIPVIEKIDKELRNTTQALILCPTRELAVQACEEMRKFAKYKHGISVVPIYGGQPIDRQIRALKTGATIVIGTPGRVMDHLRRRTLKLQNLSMVVLDEADEMLNMGFREDIETILQDVPSDRQTILFSATMPPEIIKITKQYQTDPKMIKIVHHELTVPSIAQYYYEVAGGKKIEALTRLLDYHNPNRSVVFCNTKRMVDELVSELQVRGYTPHGLHGDMKQQSRTHVMDMFKAGTCDILIATDVAARGIDVNDIDAVFNFDIPQDEEYYVHRIGRTGRAGKSGTAYTLVCGRKQIFALRDIQRYIKTKIDLKQLPTTSEVQAIRNEKLIEQISQTLQAGNFQKYEMVVDKLLENDFTSVDIACAVLQMLDQSSGETSSKEDINARASSRQHDDRFGQSSSKKVRVNRERSRDRGNEIEFPKEAMTRLIVSVGKKDRVSAGHLLAAIAGESGLSGKCIGSIEVLDNYSFVEVPKDAVDLVLKAMNGCVINGRTSSIEVVKNKKRMRK